MTHGHDEQHEAAPHTNRLDALEGQIKMILAMLDRAGIRPPAEEEPTEPPAAKGKSK